ncbi:MAG: Gfo/Idh/MocA family protein [Saccharospirillum sp.]
MQTPPIRCGLIGYGLSGRVFHAPFISMLEAFTLQAVVTRSGQQVHERYPDARIETDSSAVFRATDIDLVIITAPNDLHAPLANEALEAGKHVLLEKPAVTRFSEMRTLAQRAREHSRILSVYQNRRFDGDFLHLKRLIEDDTLGQLKHLDVRFDRFRPTPQQRWREQPGEGTGIFWDLGPHLLDQALTLLGPPDTLQANLNTLRAGGQTTDWFDVHLAYPGIEVVLGSTPFEPGPMRRFNARFTGGSWQCWGLDPQEEALRAGQMPWEAHYPSAGAAQHAERYAVQPDGEVLRTDDAPEPGHYRHYYQALADAITGRGPVPVSVEDANALIYGLELAEHSSRLGQRLAWQPDT